VPDNYVAGGPTCQDVTVDCADETGINFWNTPMFCIDGYKYNNSTGLGLAGWTINLYESDGTTLIATTATDETGYYQFCDLVSGDYIVCEEVQDGWVAVSDECVAVTLECEDGTVDFYNTPPITCGTACAAQTAPGEFLFSDEQSNWFTWIYYDIGDGNSGAPKTYPIYYGQDQLCGTLEVYDAGTNVYVRYNIDDMDSCVADSINSYHLQVNDSFDALDAIICPQKNPVPGKAQYTTPGAGGWFVIDISGFTYPDDHDLYIFAHAIFCFFCP
jgi:hypothetical protein